MLLIRIVVMGVFQTCCCFGTSVAVTRWIIQDELRVQNSQCDNCLLATMLFLQQLACICQILACVTGDDTLGQLADLISFIAEAMWWSVCACLQTQHKVQLDERDMAGGTSRAPNPTPMQAPVQVILLNINNFVICGCSNRLRCIRLDRLAIRLAVTEHLSTLLLVTLLSSNPTDSSNRCTARLFAP